MSLHIIEHELKHVIDNIIGDSYHDFFVETPAHLYERTNINHGLKRDFNGAVKKAEYHVKFAQDRLDRYKEDNMLTGIVEAGEIILNRKKEKLEELKTELESDFPRQMEIFKQFTKVNLTGKKHFWREEDQKIKSYLFATMPRNKLFKRIEELTYLSEKDIDRLDELAEEGMLFGLVDSE